MTDSDSDCPVYCICRSSNIDGFMIGCDNCNEWFHGSCIGITEKDADKISRYFCKTCKAKKNKNLAADEVSVVKKPKAVDIMFSPPLSKKRKIEKEKPPPPKPEKKESKDTDAVRADGAGERVSGPSSRSHTPTGCGQCIGCFRNEDCGKCDYCADKRKGKMKGGICKMRRCVQLKSLKDKGNQRLSQKKSRGDAAAVDISEFTGFSRTRLSKKRTGQFLREAGLATDFDPAEAGADEDLRQCLGPQCCSAARLGSKYCSDACGLKLATLRIQDLLPERYAAFNAKGGPVATKHALQRLERINADKSKAKDALEALDQSEKELKEWLQLASKEPVAEDTGEGDGEQESEHSVACCTCGHEVPIKNAVRHMSRCFAKFESQTSYGSANKTVENVYDLFCDEYNPRNKTYCKRLKVICPEHAKDKPTNDEICGCPLTKDMNLRDPSKMCPLGKQRCRRHYKWDKVAFALIAMNRLNQLVKLDELWDEERVTNEAMKERGNVLGLLFHSTIAH